MTANTIENSEARSKGSSRISEDCCETLLTVADVAELLRVPASWVYERTRRRGTERLPHLKLGKYLRFSQPEVLNWLQRMRGI
jgi:excisionase family DNA binding protein